MSGGTIPTSETSIDRAQCEADGRIEIRGASTTAPETVTFFDADTDAELGSVDVEENPEGPTNPFRFRADVDELPGGSCPQAVRAENTNGSQAVVEL